MAIKVKVINKSNNPLPKYEHPTDAGMDMRASFKNNSPENLINIYGKGEMIFKDESHPKTLVNLYPMSRAVIPTDIYTAIPEGYEIQIRPRSGMAIKQGLTVINTPGTIDSHYRNQWGLPVINLSDKIVTIEDGDRICQAVFKKVEHVEWEEVDVLDETDRNLNGFGSTNIK